MKKVLEVFTFQDGYMGGIATMVKSYIDGVEEFANYNCELTHLNIAPTIHTGKSSLDNLAYILTQRKEVRKHLKENKYDVIHIHTSREFLFLKDVLLAKMISTLTNTPIVMTIHVGAMDTVYNRIEWFKAKSISVLNKYVSKTIFLSKVMREDFIKAGLDKHKSTVLYNFHNFTPTNKIPEKKDGLQLLFVGAIHREKGILELLHAIEQMPDLKCHLSICGKLTDNSIKDEVESLKAKLSNKVSFLGYVTGENKTLLYEQSDVLILPSYHEGLPLVIMEALGAGCAIMATKVGAIPEVLDDNSCFWIDIASVDSIIKKLKNIDKDMISSVRRKNRTLGEMYSFKKHVRNMCNIYNDLPCLKV